MFVPSLLFIINNQAGRIDVAYIKQCTTNMPLLHQMVLYLKLEYSFLMLQNEKINNLHWF
jgi:hypothetical protein